MREKENLHSALMALMTSHQRALEDLRVKQDAKDQIYAKEREDRNDAQVKVASEHDVVLKTQQRAFEELQRNMATQLISSNLSVLSSVALKFIDSLSVRCHCRFVWRGYFRSRFRDTRELSKCAQFDSSQ